MAQDRVLGIEQKVDLLFKKIFNLKSTTSFGTNELIPDGERSASFLNITKEQIWSESNRVPLTRNPLNPGLGAGGAAPSLSFVPNVSSVDISQTDYSEIFFVDAVPGGWGGGIGDAKSDFEGTPQFRNYLKGPGLDDPDNPGGGVVTETVAPQTTRQTKDYSTLTGHPHVDNSELSGSYTWPSYVYSIDGEPVFERVVIPLVFEGSSRLSWRYFWNFDELDLKATTTEGNGRIIPSTFRPDLDLTILSGANTSLYNYVIGSNFDSGLTREEQHQDALKGIFTDFIGLPNHGENANWFFDTDSLQLNFFAGDTYPSNLTIGASSDAFITNFFGGTDPSVTGSGGQPINVVKYNPQGKWNIGNADDPVKVGGQKPPTSAAHFLGTDGGVWDTDMLYIMCYRYVGAIGIGDSGGVSGGNQVETPVVCKLWYLDDTTFEPSLGATTSVDKLSYLAGLTQSTEYVILAEGVDTGLTASNGATISNLGIFTYNDTLGDWDEYTKVVGEGFLLEEVDASIDLPISLSGATPSGLLTIPSNNLIYYADFTGGFYTGTPDGWDSITPSTNPQSQVFVNCSGETLVWNGTDWIVEIVQTTYCFREDMNGVTTFIPTLPSTPNYSSLSIGVDPSDTVDFDPVPGCFSVLINGIHIDWQDWTLFGQAGVSANLEIDGVTNLGVTASQIFGTSSFLVDTTNATSLNVITGDYVTLVGATVETRKVESVAAEGLTYSRIGYQGDDMGNLTAGSHFKVAFRDPGDVQQGDIMFWKAPPVQNGQESYQLDTLDCVTYVYDTTDPGAQP